MLMATAKTTMGKDDNDGDKDKDNGNDNNGGGSGIPARQTTIN
jgi:hypothetical protein